MANRSGHRGESGIVRVSPDSARENGQYPKSRHKLNTPSDRLTHTCSRCGATLRGSILEGLCPHCVAAGTLDDFDTSHRQTDAWAYELISEMGRGGMGVVYLARQRTLDRLVALKTLAGDFLSHPGAEERFLREAREAARLHHPHIVPVHDVGRHQDRPYYSMDLIEGEDLLAFAARHRPKPREAARLVAKAARAVQHAHDNGILHRDLKPGNLLIDKDGEPHLTDFGLAVAQEGGSGLTRTGEVLGSPSYMAPEQLHGESSVASDVYGLGAILYFLIVGRPPFVAAQLPELIAAVEQGDPLPPQRLDPSIPGDLSTIALHALLREPERRYPSASAFADDLDRWLEGRPILARPVSTFDRAWRWARRNKMLSILASGLNLAVALGVAGVFWQWRRAEHAAKTTVENLYSADLKTASDAIRAGDLGTARRTLTACPERLRDAAWGLLWPLTTGDAESTIGTGEWTVTHLAVSPDGIHAASTAQADRVRLWDLRTPGPLGELPDTSTSWWTAFTPDGEHLLTAGRVIQLWDLSNRTVLREFPGHYAALSPDGQILYACTGERFVYEGDPGEISAWRVSDGTKLFEIPGPARVVAVSPDGSRLAVSDAATRIALYDATDGRQLIAAWPPQDRLWDLEFSPDNRLLAASGWSKNVRVWDLADVSRPPVQLIHPLNTWDAVFSADGSLLAVGCSDRAIHLWNTDAWNERNRLLGHDHEVWALAWLPDGRLLSSGRDPRILRWNPAELPSRGWLRHDSPSLNLVWLNEGKLATDQVTTGGGHATVIASAIAPGDEERFPDETALAYDPRESRLWTWADTGELRGRSLVHPDDAVHLTWPTAEGIGIVDIPRVVPAARRAWAELSDHSLELVDLDRGSVVARQPHVFNHPTHAAALSPDGRWFVWGGLSTELFIMDLKSGRREALEGHYYDVASVVFAPDGRTFVTGGADGLIFSWTTDEPHRRREIGRHITSVGQLAFSPDGGVLASDEAEIGVHLWHPDDGREVGLLHVPDQGAGEWVGWSPDAHWLGLRLASGEIRVFPVKFQAAR